MIIRQLPMLLSSSCIRPATNSAIAAFSISSSRTLPFSNRWRPQPISTATTLSLSQSSNDNIGEGDALSSSPDNINNRDWYMDGREAARQLKIELGLMSPDDDDEEMALDSDDGDGSKKGEFAANDAILESGRAAARELLKQMQMDDDETNKSDESEVKEDTEGSSGLESGGSAAPELLKQMNESESIEPKDVVVTASAEELQTKSETSTPMNNHQTSQKIFNTPSRKSHCMTICLVPPPSSTKAWEQLTAIRKECKDPGFYRWPPHANIVYPFLEPAYDKTSEDSKETQRHTFREEVANALARAAKQCKPFDVTIDSFGTFGGKNRGVMWAYPKSKYLDDIDGAEDDGIEPLIHLQSCLEEQFPMCKDQRKGGKYSPHMTVSHYANNEDALAAKESIESKWEPVTFHVPEVYLLERKGDDGQFKIAATIPLGPESDDVKMHDTPIAFSGMPDVEEEWVYEERMIMKNRRKQGNKRRQRGGRSRSKDRDDIATENDSSNTKD